jgi:hypothetical protein
VANPGGVKLSLGHLKDDLAAHIECLDVCLHVVYVVWKGECEDRREHK